MTKLAISVLTPTYNRAHTLHRAYDNLKRQKNRDFEWVVADTAGAMAQAIFASLTGDG